MSPADDPGADPVAVAREIALRQLTVRARTEAELRAALARRHVPTEAVDEVVERFSEVGLLDDVAYARDWVASGERRFKSRRSLAQELAAKGVDRETIDSALESRDAEVELEAARALGRKKAAATQGLDPAVRYRRLAGALARRGFSGAVVAAVVRETLREPPMAVNAEAADPWVTES
ncbi:MAG: regulatory protein RecX [Propionicimonas sp.]